MNPKAQEAVMNAGSDQVQALLDLQVDSQDRELLRIARGRRVDLFGLISLAWPLLLLGMTVFDKSLSSAERTIAFASALGLLSSFAVLGLEMNRRTEALVRLLERMRDRVR
jgi:hypothetical protein